MLIRELIFLSMKKRIYLILLSVPVFFFSCKDNTKFTEQLFTNQEITSALRLCKDSAVFYTCNALCLDTAKPGLGYYYFDANSYRITLPPAAKSVMDTLAKHGFDVRLDSLVNRAAERCGNEMVRQFWKAHCDSIVFPNPHATLHGGKSPVTDFVKQTKQTEFISVLVNSVLIEQFKELQVITTWDSLQKAYFNITGIYAPIDILNPAAQQMVTGFFRKMAIEEYAIRTDPSRQGSPKGTMRRVFATL